MKKRNIIRALIYIALALGTFTNLYFLKRDYDSSVIYIQTNYDTLNSCTTPDELVEKYGDHIKKMKFPNKYKHHEYLNVYITDNIMNKHISIIARYYLDNFVGGETTLLDCCCSANINYWPRIIINFIIILISLAGLYFWQKRDEIKLKE